MIHLAIHAKDRVAWGRDTLCGKLHRKRDRRAFDVTVVDCLACRRWIDGWTPARVAALLGLEEGI